MKTQLGTVVVGPGPVVRHFKSAGARRAYEAGIVGLDVATRLVQTYRGSSARYRPSARTYSR